MKLNKITFYAAWMMGMVFSVSSCVDLDPYPTNELDEEETWKYPERVQGMIGSMYGDVSTSYLTNETAYLECATDNAVSTSLTRDMTTLALNTLTRNSDPFSSMWNRDYKRINQANIFLKDNRGLNLRYMVDEKKNWLLSRRLQGEAYGLRAWFYWDLLQKFGGAALDNGDLLGVPLVLDPIDNPVGVNVPRASYDDCVKQIITDCDSAISYLPVANRDFLSDTPEVIGSRGWSRVDGITMKAIKALVYLSWASPRFNPQNQVARWDSVAKYAKEVIDFKLTVDSRNNTNNPNRTTAFSPEVAIDWVNPSFAGAIWASQYGFGTPIESTFYPGGFNGNGSMGPTQELVDAFGMKNGYPITDPRSGYDPKHPYENRDPRFYTTIFYHGETITRTSNKKKMYTFDMTADGKDAANVTSKNSLTNYYIRKFVYMDIDLTDANNVGSGRRGRFIIEWSHMCLAFAEAANQLNGPITPVYGMTAKEAIRYIRARTTEDNVVGFTADDPYLDEMSRSKDSFEQLLKNERRITLCFDGNRFYDLRRWNTTMEELNKPVHRVEIVKSANGDLNYSYPEVQKRNFTSPYLPIPYKEMLRVGDLRQNQGWDVWK